MMAYVWDCVTGSNIIRYLYSVGVVLQINKQTDRYNYHDHMSVSQI